MLSQHHGISQIPCNLEEAASVFLVAHTLQLNLNLTTHTYSSYTTQQISENVYNIAYVRTKLMT